MGGVSWDNVRKTSELIGIKIFLNEFVAYEDLSAQIVLRESGTVPQFYNGSSDANWIDERSEAIVTYALCGFANVGSIGIMLGGLSAMAPNRQGDLAENVVRALIGGCTVSFMNACIAGFLYDPQAINCNGIYSVTNSSMWNTDEWRLIECCSRDGATAYETLCCSYDWGARTNETICG